MATTLSPSFVDQSGANGTSVASRASVAVLELTGPGGHRETRDIRSGESLFVGSEDSAELRITGPDISPAHCMLRADNTFVTVRDCYSESGTFVNGQKISELRLRGNAEVSIGAFRLTITFRHPQPLPLVAAPSSTARAAAEMPPLRRTNDAQDAEHRAESFSEPIASVANEETAELREQLARAKSEVEVLRDRLKFAAPAAADADTDPYKDEVIELLRTEVVELQAALATRSEPQTAIVSPDHDDDSISRDEAERLVGRLEELLQELTQKDEQILLLTQLLEAAEAGDTARDEERQHLDAWVRDIEQRFVQRESEWQAKLDKQQGTIAKLTVERNMAEASLTSSASNAQLEVLQRSLKTQREETETLRQRLEESEHNGRRLKRELDDLGRSVSREEAVRLCQERAELARQRQELELQSAQREVPADAEESTVRFQALRQHLKEIHLQEQQQRQDNSLASRLSKLWHRLEGR